MIKKILLILMTSIFALAMQQDFLEPEEAFKTSFEKHVKKTIKKEMDKVKIIPTDTGTNREINW